MLHDQPPRHEHGEESDGHAGESEGPYTVPYNEVFVLGDNREHSDDSRRWVDGVRIDAIKGRAGSIWMAFANGRIARSRIGSDLGAPPKCPDGFAAATCAALERCLANRPPRDATTPPLSTSTGAANPHP